MNRTALSHCLVCALALGELACAGSTPDPEAPPSAEPPSNPDREDLDPKRIVYSMRGNEDDYRKCFMRAMGSSGLIAVDFDVDAGGEVEDVAIARTTVGEDHVSACITERLRQQHFGNLPGARTGHWTFVFRLTERMDDDDRERLLAEADEASVGPSIRVAPGSTGQLDPARIEDTVLAQYPLFAHCYRDSIGRRGQSRGIFRVRLRIAEDGRVSALEDAGSIMPDAYAVDCMAGAFYAIEFPRPTGGPATIDYRLDLE